MEASAAARALPADLQVRREARIHGRFRHLTHMRSALLALCEQEVVGSIRLAPLREKSLLEVGFCGFWSFCGLSKSRDLGWSSNRPPRVAGR